jgi:Dolichyl-phosphate-mannose-protein mannosyltransferase
MMKRSSPRSRFFTASAVLLAASAAVDALVLALGKIAWTSDQAVVGLMARHILKNGEHPVFYWGSGYAGTIEPHLLAGVFALLGPTLFAYRLGMVLFLLAGVALTTAAARRMFGDSCALFTLAVLAVPPFAFLSKGLTSDGAYDALFFLTTLILWTAFEAERRLAQGRPAVALFATMGLSAGLGFWLDPLIAIPAVAVLLWFSAVRRAVFRRPRELCAFIAGLAAGVAPVLVHFLRHGGTDVADAGRFVFPLTFDSWLSQARLLWSRGIPIWMGGREIYHSADSFPGAGLIAILIFLVPAAAAGITVARRRPEARALALLLAALACAFVLLPFHRGVPWLEVRYLFALTGAQALLLGWSLASLFGRSRRLAAVALAAALAWNAASIARAPKTDSVAYKPDHGSVAALTASLEAAGIHSVYSSYWIAYRLDFESGEKIIAAQDPVPQYGSGWLVRYAYYFGPVDSDPRPAVLLSGDDAVVFRRGMRNGGFSFREVPASPFSIFTDLDPRILAQIRQTHHIPYRKPG